MEKPTPRPAARASGLLNVIFASRESNSFDSVLKDRTNQYFNNAHISKKANALMYTKSAFFMGGWLLIYLVILSAPLPPFILLLLAMLLGFFLTCIGFNIGHDAIHGAYSTDPWISRIACLAFEFIGASSYTWKIRHNVIHHTYTNIIGSDGDLESMPLLRFCVKPGRKWYHSYQHFYAPILYCFVTLVWVLNKDFKHLREEKRDQRLNMPPPPSAIVGIVACKMFHYTVCLLIPFLVLGLPFWQILIGFFAMHFVAGFVMATVFQLGHIVEGPDFLACPATLKIDDSWAVHQLKTSANFGSGILATWFCGGLNYQIEHHLFPTVCHVHYPALAKIVSQTAREFNLPYHDLGSFSAGLRSHFRMLRYFGRTDACLATRDVPTFGKTQMVCDLS